MMPSPYKTKCLDYNKIGCKSRSDCVDRCNVEWALKHCNGSLPSKTIIDRYNDKDTFNNDCNDNYKEYCEQKHQSPDCINEYYTIKLVIDKKFEDLANVDKIFGYLKFNETFKSNNKNAKADINLLSLVQIYFNNEPDTIYTHSPQQYPIEFICLIGGVISLWTGFSVFSIYAFGKRLIRREENQIEPIKSFNVTVSNIHKHFFVKKNDRILIKKLRKIVKKKNNLRKFNTDYVV